MKLSKAIFFALVGLVLATEPSIECAGVTGTPTKKKETCAEQCEAALKAAKAKSKQEAQSEDPQAIAAAAAALHKAMVEQMEESCELSSVITKPTVAPWYKSVWFICLISIIAALAVLGAVYHFMGHPGLNYGDSSTDNQPVDPITNVDRNAIPEDAERLM